jgi:osmotically-inducible protein OsmY
MPHRRHDPESSRPGYWRDRYGRERERGTRYQTGSERDRYETGHEQRYAPDWRHDTPGPGGGYEGNRSYPQGGYREEFGYRDDTGYSEFDRLGWARDKQGDEYFGTGSHYGGGFGTAPSSRASSAGTYGAPGYAAQGAWSEPFADWDEDAQSQPSFRGRGPKGYTRSDDRLRETICERLTDDPRIDAGEIEIDVKEQVVTLKGTVDDRRTKYAVEELVEMSGARSIDNQLRVKSSLWR